MNSETLSPERSVEDDYLLARSTKKSKVGVQTKGNTSVVDAGSSPSADVGLQAETDEEMVPETPVDGLPPQSAHGSDMQIENTQDALVAGDQNEAVAGSQELPSDPPAAVRPRSYLDSVVGQGSEAAPFLVDNLNAEATEVLEDMIEGHEQDLKDSLEVNGILSVMMDLKREKIVVHVMDGVLRGAEFE
nr:uncharacterized protein LOC109148036 [Ipomoea batatas]